MVVCVAATMKVSVEVLRRLHTNLQDQDDGGEVHTDGLNPENHLFFIDAYEMPRWHWSTERGAFERCGYSQLSSRVLALMAI